MGIERPSRQIPLLLAGVLLIGLSLYAASDQAQAGAPWTAAATAAAGALFGGWLMFASGSGPVAARLRLGADPERPGHSLAFLLVSFSLYFVFGAGVIVATTASLEALSRGVAAADLLHVTRSQLLLGLLLGTTIFLLPVVAWTFLVERGRAVDVRSALGLSGSGLEQSVSLSILVVVAVFLGLGVLGAAASALGVALPENTLALSIGRAVDLPLALLVSVLSAVGEEVFFRGFLQRKVGFLPQAVLFCAAHAVYLNGIEIAGTFLLGIGFGFAMRRTGNLWGPILGHLSFNFVSLLLLLAIAR